MANQGKLHVGACVLTWSVACMVMMAGASCRMAGHKGLAVRPAASTTEVQVVRDHWGVPHVFAPTDAGAFYGLGYATAQDRAFQMYYQLRIIQGRLAEVIGDAHVGVTRQVPNGRTSALQSDLRMRTIGYWPAAQRTADRLDPESRALLEAYCQGVNDYVQGHGSDLLYLFKTLGLDPEPWTPGACIASWWRLGLFFSGDGLNEAAAVRAGPSRAGRTAEPGQGPRLVVRDDAAVVQRSDCTEAWVRQVQQYALDHGLTPPGDGQAPAPAEGPRFSHAWVIGKSRTTDGSAVLVSDPQTPVRNPSLFYEAHVQGATFNGRGIGVPGSPIVLIGFTSYVAWGVTALGADQADLFILKTDPNRPNQYLWDGQWRHMEVRDEVIAVKDSRPTRLTVRITHLGPVVTRIASGLPEGLEVALKRIPLAEPDQDTFQAAMAMLRARDTRQFQRALGAWRFPSANCVFGDRAGTIGYQTILALPIRSRFGRTDGQTAHEGWRSECDWQGTLTPDLLPHVIDPAQGWLVSANHRPIASFYPIPMGISTGSLGDTDRSWRLKERINTHPGAFTPEDVLDIHFDTVSAVKRDIARFGYHLRDVQGRALEPETLQVLEYLTAWYAQGARSDLSIRGTEVMDLMPMAFRQQFEAATIYGGGGSGLCNMLQTIEARLSHDPNAALTDPEAEYVDIILRAAWRYAQSQYGQDPNAWLERARQGRAATSMGYMTTLDGFESLDPNQDIPMPPLRCVDGGTIQSQRAQSYTQYVPLSDPDRAQTILPPGQSEHPDSPHRLATYDLWKQGALHPAPLSRAQVDRIAAAGEVLTLAFRPSSAP